MPTTFSALDAALEGKIKKGEWMIFFFCRGLVTWAVWFVYHVINALTPYCTLGCLQYCKGKVLLFL